jgi:hypothetical protein
MMSLERIAEHLLISVVPTVIAGALGWLLGLGVARPLLALLARRPGAARLLVIVPWRAVTMAPLLFLPALPIWTGLGRSMGMWTVGVFAFLLALPHAASAFLEDGHSHSVAARAIAQSRSLLVAGVVVAAFAGYFGGTGMGLSILQAMQGGGFASAVGPLLAVGALALAVDLVTGIVQGLIFGRLASSRPASSGAD